MTAKQIIHMLWIIAIALFLSVTMAMAQEPSAGNLMTLHDCMAYAISNSTRMRIEQANRDDEQWQRRQAIMQVFTPVVEAQTYAYNQYGRNLDPETNTYNNVTTFYNGYSVSAGLTLFDGFRSVNNLKMAKTMVRMGLSQQQQIRDEICLAVMQAYSNVVYYTNLEQVLTEQVSTAQTARDKAVRQEELGQKGHADVLQMESELAQKQYQLINATNHRQDAMITLKDVMFWPGGEELQIDCNIHDVVTNTEAEAEATQLAETAKSVLPSAAMAQANVRKATLDLKMARGAYSPRLSLYGGWSTTYYTYPGMKDYTPASFANQFRNNGGEYIEVALSIPIFDQLQRRTSLHARKNALIRSQAEYDQKMRDIENEVTRAVNERDGAAAAFRQADKLADLQQEAFQLSTKQFANGLISAIEYQTASQTYLNALAERINAQLVLNIKNAVVQYYQGIPYIEQSCY